MEACTAPAKGSQLGWVPFGVEASGEQAYLSLPLKKKKKTQLFNFLGNMGFMSVKD